MEKKIVTCPYQLKEQIIEYHTIFSYKLIRELNRPFSRKKLVFARDVIDEKTKSVETKYRLYPFITFVPAVVGCFLQVVLGTIYLIFNLNNIGEKMTNFLCFMLPTFLILPSVALYTYIRYRFDSHNINLLTDLKEVKKELEE